MAWKTYEELIAQTKNAQNIIKWKKIDQKYEAYKELRLKWINSPSVIAKTIWVSNRTAIRYSERWRDELSYNAWEIEKRVELQKILSQIELVYSESWDVILNWDLKWRDKVSALNSLLWPIKLKAEILALDKWNFHFTNNTPNYNPMMSKEIFEYWGKKIEAYNIDINELTGIHPL